MPSELVRKIQRGLRKPPHVIARRLWQEARAELDRILLPRQVSRFDAKSLLSRFNCKQISELWQQVAAKPYCTNNRHIDFNPEVLLKAECAMRHEVNLLGSGDVSLGNQIDWHCDYKTGRRWDNAYFRSIDYNNLDQPSDVKFPWELSRLQWLIPVGQAYLATHDERFAEFAKKILSHWIDHNPVGGSVNWACTMEAAMRIFTWTWFFHVFKASHAWQEESFQAKFLISLYWHGAFTERYIEQSDINGNHFTADAAAMVVAGLFWPVTTTTLRWQQKGWAFMEAEIVRQVFDDGVDFEASTAYHRLVAELFFVAAKIRDANNMTVSKTYRERLIAMGYFTQSYTRPDGSCPLWGDADDARVLPFGSQSINDHRYLPFLIGQLFQEADLMQFTPGDKDEVLGWFDIDANFSDENNFDTMLAPFDSGGFYIMRNQSDHVFIDCGPLGLAGRGGHGHNDCLSFSAMLSGIDLVVDRGAYSYTGDPAARNEFRSTASHNTPQIDGEEINRFIAPHYLWNLYNDAHPEAVYFDDIDAIFYFSGSHTGYDRLDSELQIKREILLHQYEHQLTIKDTISGQGQHKITIPLHFAPGIAVMPGDNGYLLKSKDLCFSLSWRTDGGDWCVALEDSSVSPSYGVKKASQKLLWQCRSNLPASLTVIIQPG